MSRPIRDEQNRLSQKTHVDPSLCRSLLVINEDQLRLCIQAAWSVSLTTAWSLHSNGDNGYRNRDKQNFGCACWYTGQWKTVEATAQPVQSCTMISIQWSYAPWTSKNICFRQLMLIWDIESEKKKKRKKEEKILKNGHGCLWLL